MNPDDRETLPESPSLRAGVRRELAEDERARGAGRPGEQTPACVSLPRLDRALEQGFDRAEAWHVRDCAFCQKRIAMVWRVRCPRLGLILTHLGTDMLSRRGAVDEELAEDGLVLTL
jgi:hypothetical protein